MTQWYDELWTRHLRGAGAAVCLSNISNNDKFSTIISFNSISTCWVYKIVQTCAKAIELYNFLLAHNSHTSVQLWFLLVLMRENTKNNLKESFCDWWEGDFHSTEITVLAHVFSAQTRVMLHVEHTQRYCYLASFNMYLIICRNEWPLNSFCYNGHRPVYGYQEHWVRVVHVMQGCYIALQCALIWMLYISTCVCSGSWDLFVLVALICVVVQDTVDNCVYS